MDTQDIVEIIVAAIKLERAYDNSNPDVGMPPSVESLADRFESKLPFDLPGYVISKAIKRAKAEGV